MINLELAKQLVKLGEDMIENDADEVIIKISHPESHLVGIFTIKFDVEEKE